VATNSSSPIMPSIFKIHCSNDPPIYTASVPNGFFPAGLLQYTLLNSPCVLCVLLISDIPDLFSLMVLCKDHKLQCPSLRTFLDPPVASLRSTTS
jgi:hypothetical protein